MTMDRMTCNVKAVAYCHEPTDNYHTTLQLSSALLSVTWHKLGPISRRKGEVPQVISLKTLVMES